MDKELFVLSDTEVKKAFVMERVLSRSMTIREAARVLSLSERQVKRLKVGVEKNGVAFLAHKNRGRKPKHAIPDELRRKVVSLATHDYRGANYSFLTELLAEYEDIHLSVSSVTRILRSAGVKSPRKRRPPKAHRTRPRRPQFGQLLQIDGSPFAWLEDRGPNLCLQAAIDDATGQVVGATFRLHEDLQGYFEVMRQVVSNYGVPLAIYSDRHTIFVPPPGASPTIEQELEGLKVARTQFGRALDELQIALIPARSPQAKGRVERLWQTLQGRLFIYLRRAGASTLEEANSVLTALMAKHNGRFAVQAQDPDSAFRPAPDLEALDQIFCLKEQRTISQGSTFTYRRHVYQVVNENGNVPVRPGARLDVHVHADGSLNVSYQGRLYQVQELLQPSKAPQPPSAPPEKRAGIASPRKPAQDHPWRKPAVLHRRPVSPSNLIIPDRPHSEVTFSQHPLG